MLQFSLIIDIQFEIKFNILPCQQRPGDKPGGPGGRHVNLRKVSQSTRGLGLGSDNLGYTDHDHTGDIYLKQYKILIFSCILSSLLADGQLTN